MYEQNINRVDDQITKPHCYGKTFFKHQGILKTCEQCGFNDLCKIKSKKYHGPETKFWLKYKYL